MWIMVTKEIFVAEEHRPAPLDIYWALPWVENCDIVKALKALGEDEMDNILREVIKDSEICPWISTTRTGNRTLHNQSVLNDPEVSSALWNIISTVPYFYDSFYGKVPNKHGLMRIMVGEEAVGVFPHECSILDKESMEEYLGESHTLVMNDVSKEIFGVFDQDQQFIKDAAMLDGCTDEEASRVALGKDVNFDFPLPYGYYSCAEELRNQFF